MRAPFLFFSLIHTHHLTQSLTHSHTHCLSHSLSVLLSLSLFLTLYLSHFLHTDTCCTNTIYRTYTASLSIYFIFTPSLSITHISLFLSYTHTRSPTLAHAHTLSYTHTPTLANTHTHTPIHTHTCVFTLIQHKIASFLRFKKVSVSAFVLSYSFLPTLKQIFLTARKVQLGVRHSTVFSIERLESRFQPRLPRT